jgi:DNA recombination protein RmuC
VPDLPLTLGLLLAGAGGFTAGSLLLALLSRRWSREAGAAGRASREPEIAALGMQLEAAAARAQAAEARIERYERDWAQAEQNLRQLSAQAAAQQAQAERLAHELAGVARVRDESQARLVELTGRHAALEAATRAEAEAAAQKLQLLEQAEQRLREAFRNLANQILDEKAERLREQSTQQVGGLLDPLKVQLKEFRDAITATHASEQRERGMLAQEIQTLKQLNQQMSADAVNLTRALKGDTRAQGAWGELVLERVLEASGLQPGREYVVQASFADGDGGRQRPDVIVRLPDEKDVVIDAKVSLVAYERFCSAAEDEARAGALGEHVASLKRHIDQLSARNYAGIDGIRTLDFVLLFVPVEAAFIEAVRADDRLYAHALSKNISLVSPSTLLATLRTVAHLWRIERRNGKADEIARRAVMLHDNFVLLVEELEAIGTQLDKAQRAHASALRRLTEGGKGSVLLQVESLAEIGQVQRRLPAALLAAAGAAAGETDAGAPSADPQATSATA